MLGQLGRWRAADRKTGGLVIGFDRLTGARTGDTVDQALIVTGVREFTLPFARVLEAVKPERSSKAQAVRDSPWWQFFRAAVCLKSNTLRRDSSMRLR